MRWLLATLVATTVWVVGTIVIMASGPAGSINSDVIWIAALLYGVTIWLPLLVILSIAVIAAHLLATKPLTRTAIFYLASVLLIAAVMSGLHAIAPNADNSKEALRFIITGFTLPSLVSSVAYPVLLFWKKA